MSASKCHEYRYEKSTRSNEVFSTQHDGERSERAETRRVEPTHPYLPAYTTAASEKVRKRVQKKSVNDCATDCTGKSIFNAMSLVCTKRYSNYNRSRTFLRIKQWQLQNASIIRPKKSNSFVQLFEDKQSQSNIIKVYYNVCDGVKSVSAQLATPGELTKGSVSLNGTNFKGGFKASSLACK
jgi:hypothetical protein